MDNNLQGASPSTFECNAATSTYQYNIPAGSGTVNNLQCACPPNSCPTTPTGTGVDVSAPTLDPSTCVYSVIATCTNPANSLIFNMDNINALDGPQTLTCVMGSYQYNPGSTPPTSLPFTSVECDCRPNSCPPFTGAGAGVEITPSTLDPATCFYASELNMNPDLGVGTPQMLVCKSGVYQLDYGGGDVATNSLTCECAPIGCGDFIGTNAEIIPSLDETTCIQTTQAVCTNNREILTINMDESTGTTIDERLTCRNGNYQYYSFPPGVNVDVTNLQCRCPADSGCSLINTNGAIVSAPMSDINCEYTIEVSCDTAVKMLAYNGNANNQRPFPQTLTCNPPSGRYFDANGDVVIDVTCLCPPDPCLNSFTTNGNFIAVRTSTSNADCTLYSVEVECLNLIQEIVINVFTDRVRAGRVETFNCDATTMKYFYTTIAINEVECFNECEPPRCRNFPSGAGITVSAPDLNNGCAVTATCDTGTQLNVELRDGRVFLTGSPETFTCITGPEWIFNDGTPNGAELYFIANCV
uniref:Uncharacterized protein n=1 Tax=Panagrolaimus sp. ES5 TaxID=591445 RepID=A0AC34GTF2_9BILA